MVHLSCRFAIEKRPLQRGFEVSFSKNKKKLHIQLDTGVYFGKNKILGSVQSGNMCWEKCELRNDRQSWHLSRPVQREKVSLLLLLQRPINTRDGCDIIIIDSSSSMVTLEDQVQRRKSHKERRGGGGGRRRERRKRILPDYCRPGRRSAGW